MFDFAGRILVKSVALMTITLLFTGCGSFALKYQNYFTKNFAYFSSNYDGNPESRLSAGAESNNFEDGNLDEYSASKYPTVITGFRSLDYHNSDAYTNVNNLDGQFTAVMVPPGKTEDQAIPLATFDLKGKTLSSTKQLPEATKIVMIKMEYPAPMVYLDNKALQAAYGSGAYTVIWKNLRYNGKTENRELARSTTNLTK